MGNVLNIPNIQDKIKGQVNTEADMLCGCAMHRPNSNITAASSARECRDRALRLLQKIGCGCLSSFRHSLIAIAFRVSDAFGVT